MKWTFRTCLVLMLVGSGVVEAQPTSPASSTPAWNAAPGAASPNGMAVVQPADLTTGCTTGGLCGDGCPHGPCIWAGAEYLLWRVENGPLSFPLVTTGSNDNPLAGQLGQPDTVVLFGGSGLNFHEFQGARFTLGLWLNEAQTFGIEARGFCLGERHLDFHAASSGSGNPPLRFPYFDVFFFDSNGTQISGENAIIISSPRDLADQQQPFSGSVAIAASSKLFGAEFNTVCVLPCGSCRSCLNDCCQRAELFAGFRFLSLEDKISIQNHSVDLSEVPVGEEGTRQVDRVDDLNESFKTRNNFYGAQIGGRMTWSKQMLSLVMQAQVALGGTHTRTEIQGTITQSGDDAFAPGVNQGGVFAQRSNIGTHDTGIFSVVPELQIAVGLRLATNLHATIGYNVLWWTNVVRAGNAMDRNLNLSQSPIFGFGGFLEGGEDPQFNRNPPLEGPAAPLPHSQRQDFWAHGFTAGLEYRY